MQSCVAYKHRNAYQFGNTGLFILERGAAAPQPFSYMRQGPAVGNENSVLHIKADSVPYSFLGNILAAQYKSGPETYWYQGNSGQQYSVYTSGNNAWTIHRYRIPIGEKAYQLYETTVWSLVNGRDNSDGVLVKQTIEAFMSSPSSVKESVYPSLWMVGPFNMNLVFHEISTESILDYCRKNGVGSWPNGLKYNTFVDAMSSVQLDMNNIANVREIVDLCKGLVKGDIFKIMRTLTKPKRARSAKALASSWMAYRYQYLTTKSDIEEFTSKIRDLPSFEATTRVARASASYEHPWGTAVYRYKIPYTRDTSSFSKAWSTLKEFGIAPDIYNFWDMVPLSFVIDWFLPIGDACEMLSKSYLTSSQFFNFGTIVSSCKTSFQLTVGQTDITFHYYERIAGESAPNMELYESSPSQKTVIKRCIDAGAMAIGMVK